MLQLHQATTPAYVNLALPQVAAVDFSAEMLEYARQRGHDRAAADSSDACIQWIQGDALDLPFSSEQFDAATVGYGLRNVSYPGQALRELCRVLKPGSKAAILDFNNSSNIFASRFQSWALQNIVVPMAESYGLGAEYEYLEPSIQRFPKGSSFPCPFFTVIACRDSCQQLF